MGLGEMGQNQSDSPMHYLSVTPFTLVFMAAASNQGSLFIPLIDGKNLRINFTPPPPRGSLPYNYRPIHLRLSSQHVWTWFRSSLYTPLPIMPESGCAEFTACAKERKKTLFMNDWDLSLHCIMTTCNNKWKMTGTSVTLQFVLQVSFFFCTGAFGTVL